MQRRAKHYDGFNFGTASYARDVTGNIKMLGGANYKPFDGSRARVCGEIAKLLGAVDEGDQLGNYWFLRSPVLNGKPIQSSRPDQRSLHMCGPCRTTVSGILLPSLTLVMFVGDESLPRESMQLSDMNFYHDNPDVPFPDEQSPSEIRDEVVAGLETIQFQPSVSVDKIQRIAKRVLPETMRTD